MIHAGVAATGLGKLCYCQSPLLLSLFLRHTTLFLVLDLSQPQELWFTLESLLQTAKSRVEAVIADMKSTDPDIKQKLQKAAWERVGEENPVKCSNFIVRTISI